MNTGTVVGANPTEFQAFTAKTALSAYVAVQQEATVSGSCELPSAKGAAAVGITRNAAALGEEVAVVKAGRFWAVANTTLGGAIAAGDNVIVASAAGDLMKDDTASTGHVERVGIARTPATADGDEFIVDLTLDYIYVP